MTGHRATYTAILACRSRLDGQRHTLTFRTAPPPVGETLWCSRCADWSRVVEAPYMWRARCLSCSWKSVADVRKTYVTVALERHARKHRTHTVQLRLGRSVYDTWQGEGQKTLEEKLESLLTGL